MENPLGSAPKGVLPPGAEEGAIGTGSLPRCGTPRYESGSWASRWEQADQAHHGITNEPACEQPRTERWTPCDHRDHHEDVERNRRSKYHVVPFDRFNDPPHGTHAENSSDLRIDATKLPRAVSG